MENTTSTDPNPFRKIEITIIIVFVIWILAIGGWFINNQNIPVQQKLVSSAETFLEKNTVEVELLDCMVDQGEESGTCKVTTTNQQKLVVQCPVTSSIFDFARVFFVKGQPCKFLYSQ